LKKTLTKIDANNYLFLRKSIAKKSRDMKIKKMNKTRRGADENTYLLLRKSKPKKSLDIK
jgi:hypothetical protein